MNGMEIAEANLSLSQLKRRLKAAGKALKRAESLRSNANPLVCAMWRAHVERIKALIAARRAQKE